MKNKPIKLLVLNYEYPPIGGGGGVASQALAQTLVKKHAYSITVITGTSGNCIIETKDEYGIRIIHIPCASERKHRSSASFSFMLNFVWKSVWYVLKNRKNLDFDLLHTHFAIPTGPAGILISKILRIPNTLTLYGGEIFTQPLELTGYTGLIRWLVRSISQQADVVTCISNDTFQGAQKLMGITRTMHVLTLGFQVPKFAVQQIVPPTQKDVLQFVMVARLVKRKALDDLVTAFANIDPACWKLTLVGDGPEEDALKSQARTLGILQNIKFAGFVSEEEKFKILSESDVFILPSLHEGLGLVYFEAMHVGLPIIATDNGGQMDFLTDPRNSLLVPIKNITALTTAIQRSIDDVRWRQECSANNLQDIQTLFIDNIIHHYDDLFRKQMTDSDFSENKLAATGS